MLSPAQQVAFLDLTFSREVESMNIPSFTAGLLNSGGIISILVKAGNPQVTRISG